MNLWPFHKPSTDAASLRDRAIIAESQVVFLQDMLRPRREVRKDASRYEKAKAARTAELLRAFPSVARSIALRQGRG
jgi:hypothetical protein